MTNNDGACSTLRRSRRSERGEDGACDKLQRSPENAYMFKRSRSSQLSKCKLIELKYDDFKDGAS